MAYPGQGETGAAGRALRRLGLEAGLGADSARRRRHSMVVALTDGSHVRRSPLRRVTTPT